MFEENKYSKIYGNIIDRARHRKLEGYAESHHVIPESLGGINIESNRVDLTAREHFICHKLLTKFTIGWAKSKMIFALHKMMFSSNINMDRYIPSSRFFETLRIDHSNNVREIMSKPKSDEHLKKIRAANSERTKGKSLEEQYGIDRAQEIKQKMRQSRSGEKNGMFGKSHSVEAKEKMSTSRQGKNFGLTGEKHPLYGKTLSAETRRRISEGGKKRPKRPVIVNGVKYESINHAAEILGRSYLSIYNLVSSNSEKHKNSYWLTVPE